VVVQSYGDDEGDPAWTRDGRALAFLARRSDTVEIHVVWPRTRRHRVLVSDYRSPPYLRRGFAYILEPTWSPDGKHIAVLVARFQFSTVSLIAARLERG
jgi:Tol biopolymer transport system component